MPANEAEKRDRWFHFFIYLLAGGAMGGFLDMTAFDMGTPVYGILTGCAIAVLYYVVIAKPWKRS